MPVENGMSVHSSIGAELLSLINTCGLHFIWYSWICQDDIRAWQES